MPNFIDSATYEQASQELPNIDHYIKQADYLTPDIISTKFKQTSTFPIAATCFQDAKATLCEARYALLESIAHKIWYREKTNPPDEPSAVFFSKFYADDAALRLYSAAEHLAGGVVYIFDISKDISSESAMSRFVKARTVLVKRHPEHPVSMAVEQLFKSTEWKTTIGYRNTWVHRQPPLVEGLGIGFERSQRWKKSETENSYKLGLGNGDIPKYSIDDLITFILPALGQFANTLSKVIEFYISELGKRGIVPDETGIGFRVTISYGKQSTGSRT